MATRPIWRLLDSGASDGYTNMAVDEAMLSAVQRGLVAPTLRLYGWNPACLSIGTFQSVSEDVDIEVCARYGIDWVRRPTGGRAILHDREVTYSVAVQQDNDRVAGDVMESYRRISLGLLEGLRLLGVEADMAPASAEMRGGRDAEAPRRGDAETGGSGAAETESGADVGTRRPGDAKTGGQASQHTAKPAACFAAPSQHEITVGGRKIIGSAQRRQGAVLLQHGSLLLDLDVDTLMSVLSFPSAEQRSKMAVRVRSESVTLNELLGRKATHAEVASALAIAFARALDVDLIPGSLTAWEEGEAARLRREKYLSDDWRFRK